MAWFECTTSASSGNGVALIVTTDAEFAGANITASNGEDTFTQQCPSSAPYVVTFEDIPTGTYTISAVSGGQTVTKTYVVSDYNFEFHNIPTGSTATPVNVIQTWLHCADIWDKTYTTINQVLADTSTLLALISSNNAADYMARSTNWASSVCANQTAMGYIGSNNYCADKLLANSTWLNAIYNSAYFESVLNAKVPTMTSATQPSGQAFSGSSYNDNYTAWHAFGSTGAFASALGHVLNEYIGYVWPIAVAIKVVRHQAYNTAERFSSYKVQGSNDGNSWVDLTGIITTNAGELKITQITNGTKYTRHRMIQTTSNGGNNVNIQSGGLQFYGRKNV